MLMFCWRNKFEYGLNFEPSVLPLMSHAPMAEKAGSEVAVKNMLNKREYGGVTQSFYRLCWHPASSTSKVVSRHFSRVVKRVRNEEQRKERKIATLSAERQQTEDTGHSSPLEE